MRRFTQIQAGVALFAMLLVPVHAGGRPGNGLTLHSWVFNPYLEVSFIDCSNIYKDRYDPIRDQFIEPELGLRFSSSSETNCFRVLGNLFYSERRYAREKNRDFNTLGDSLAILGGSGRRSKLELVQSFRRLDDNDRHVADLETSELAVDLVQDSNTLDLERDIHQFGGTASRRFTDKLDLGLAYRYSGVQYENQTHYRLDPKDLGVPRGLDLDGHILQFDGGLGLTDKTDATLTLRHGRQYQEETDGSARLDTLRLGLKTQGGSKLVYTGGIGAERYARPPHIDDEVRTTLNYTLALDWYITEKVTFRCGGYNGTQFSSFYKGNGMEYLSFWTGLGYRIKPSTTLSGRFVFRNDDYLDPVTHQGQTVDRHDTRLTANARVDYRAPGGFMRLYAEAIYDEVISNLDFVEYVDTRIVLGGDLRY